MALAFDVARIVLAAYFLIMGFNHFTNLKSLSQYAAYKKLPAPAAAVAVTGLMLLAGGVSLLFWTQVLWGAALAALFLVLAAFLVHNFWVETDPNAKAGQMAQFTKNIAIAAAVIALATISGA